jgi:hypothetical protein
MPGTMCPMTFADELAEIIGDIRPDLDATFPDIDPDTLAVLARDVVLPIFDRTDGDPEQAVAMISSAMLWMVMVGREHLARGYPTPAARTGGGVVVNDEDLEDL